MFYHQHRLIVKWHYGLCPPVQPEKHVGRDADLSAVIPETLEQWTQDTRAEGYASVPIRRKFATARVTFRVRRKVVGKSPMWGFGSIRAENGFFREVSMGRRHRPHRAGVARSLKFRTNLLRNRQIQSRHTVATLLLRCGADAPHPSGEHRSYWDGGPLGWARRPGHLPQQQGVAPAGFPSQVIKSW